MHAKNMTAASQVVTVKHCHFDTPTDGQNISLNGSQHLIHGDYYIGIILKRKVHWKLWYLKIRHWDMNVVCCKTVTARCKPHCAHTASRRRNICTNLKAILMMDIWFWSKTIGGRLVRWSDLAEFQNHRWFYPIIKYCFLGKCAWSGVWLQSALTFLFFFFFLSLWLISAVSLSLLWPQWEVKVWEQGNGNLRGWKWKWKLLFFVSQSLVEVKTLMTWKKQHPGFDTINSAALTFFHFLCSKAVTALLTFTSKVRMYLLAFSLLRLIVYLK